MFMAFSWWFACWKSSCQAAPSVSGQEPPPIPSQRRVRERRRRPVGRTEKAAPSVSGQEPPPVPSQRRRRPVGPKENIGSMGNVILHDIPVRILGIRVKHWGITVDVHNYLLFDNFNRRRLEKVTTFFTLSFLPKHISTEYTNLVNS